MSYFKTADSELPIFLSDPCDTGRAYASKTRPAFGAGRLPSIGRLRLSHIDCDLYDGVMASYEGSRTKMVPDGYIVFDDPLVSSCLGALEAIESLVIRRDGLYAEQVFPHLVYRAPAGP